MIQIVFQGILGIGGWKNVCRIACDNNCDHNCQQPGGDQAASYSSGFAGQAKPIHS